MCNLFKISHQLSSLTHTISCLGNHSPLLLAVLLCGAGEAGEDGRCVSGRAEDAAPAARHGGVSPAIWLHLRLYVRVY